ncbi:RidA family protein [Prauserella muralis]|uniref:Enamine deaminase RidA n=1 Tax=Prauserella muralis TaxID=588067 RepID=A0A2V4AK56_9PSEU|nr:RidA family protein [Prauserella muralis]PXY20668.1 enamine deaminase RidA [Prauserella muralis]TWE29660.1 reactive intermediate/imine deaminase [Prauserella muralis]
MIIERIGGKPDWYEPYNISLGIRAGELLFLSGQAGIDEHGRTVAGGFTAQARQAFANLATVLGRAGAGLADVVKVTIMVTDMSRLDEIIALRAEFFSEPYPADTLVQVAGLAQPDWLIEIDAVAALR